MKNFCSFLISLQACVRFFVIRSLHCVFCVYTVGNLSTLHLWHVADRF